MGSVFGLSFREGCERSEEHTSELQSQSNLVCRLLLEIKTAAVPLAVHYRWLPLKLRQPVADHLPTGVVDGVHAVSSDVDDQHRAQFELVVQHVEQLFI